MPRPTAVALLALSLASASAGTRAHAGASVVVRVDATQPTHTVNPLYMGCHSDSGFGQQVRSFYSNLLYGESFEPGASHTACTCCVAFGPWRLAHWSCCVRLQLPGPHALCFVCASVPSPDPRGGVPRAPRGNVVVMPTPAPTRRGLATGPQRQTFARRGSRRCCRPPPPPT